MGVPTAFVHNDQLFGLRIGEGPQEHRIDNAEDRAVRADTQSERQNRNDCECRPLGQHA